MAGSAGDGVAEVFDIFAETSSGVTARKQRGKQNKNDKAFHHL